MNTKRLVEVIEKRNLHEFYTEWASIKNSLNEKDKQEILTEIFSYRLYKEKYFKFFIKVCDKIIESKVSLDFNIDQFAPSFLSLIADQASIQLFDYFLRKGASLNFVADQWKFERESRMGDGSFSGFLEQYATCLDFLENKFHEMFWEYYYYVPETDEDIISALDVDENEMITVKKRLFYHLIEQSAYLHELVHTHKLINRMKGLGGKTYEELKKENKRLLK